MPDPVAKLRQKARFILEIRYPVVPELMDRRGRMVSAVLEATGDTFAHWTVDQHQVVFKDTKDNASVQFVTAAARSSVTIEDRPDIDPFLDRAMRYLRAAHGVIGESLEVSSRLGVRFIEVIAPDPPDRFSNYRDLCLEKFHVVPDLELPPRDSFAKIVHKEGSYQVGPVKRGEDWVKSMFTRPDDGVPKAGVGFDIDSYAQSVDIADLGKLEEAVRAVCELTRSVEEGLTRHLGLLDE